MENSDIGAMSTILIMYLFLLIASQDANICCYFPSARAMPSPNSFFFFFFLQRQLWEQRFQPLHPAKERLGYPYPLINAGERCSRFPDAESDPAANHSVTARQYSRTQRKPSKTSKRNLLGDERENYDGNHLY